MGKYSLCYYHGIMVLVGNEINPIDSLNVFIISLLYIAGALILANIFATVTVIIQNMNQKEKLFQDKMGLASTAMQSMQLPHELQDEILQFITATQNNLDQQEELDRFLSLISPSLKASVIKHIFRTAIEQNGVLKHVHLLLQEVTAVLFQPEDKVVC